METKEGGQILDVNIFAYGLNFVQKIKKHYKSNKFIYNVIGGLLCLVMVVFYFNKPKKTIKWKKW